MRLFAAAKMATILSQHQLKFWSYLILLAIRECSLLKCIHSVYDTVSGELLSWLDTSFTWAFAPFQTENSPHTAFLNSCPGSRIDRSLYTNASQVVKQRANISKSNLPDFTDSSKHLPRLMPDPITGWSLYHDINCKWVIHI